MLSHVPEKDVVDIDQIRLMERKHNKTKVKREVKETGYL